MAARTDIARTPKSFELTVDGRRAGFLAYTIEDRTLAIDYVEVDPAFRGRGLGEKLVDAAVEFASTGQLEVVPICGYARSVLKRRKKI
jgi:predicted GNAT family acetyltransferase